MTQENGKIEFTIDSREGLSIRGSIDLPPVARAVVIVIHGFKGFRQWGFFPWLAESLSSTGCAVVRFDMSRSGVGENCETFERLDLFRDDTYSAQLADLHSVISFVREQSFASHLPLFLLGHSRGGGIAIVGAAEEPSIAGVVTWNAIATADRWDEATKRRWREDGELVIENQRTRQKMPMSTAILDDFEENRARLDIPAAAERLRCPLLLLHGGADESVPVEEARRIAPRAANGALVIIGSASHTFGAIHPLVHVPRELDLAREVSARFILSYAVRHESRLVTGVRTRAGN